MMKLLPFPVISVLVLASAVECTRKKKEMEEDDLKLPEETRLYKYLTDRYDCWNPDGVIIPVQNVKALNVSFGLSLISLLDYDELLYSNKTVFCCCFFHTRQDTNVGNHSHVHSTNNHINIKDGTTTNDGFDIKL